MPAAGARFNEKEQGRPFGKMDGPNNTGATDAR